MFDFQSKFKRQIEILGLCLQEKKSLRITNLADYFNVEELTIKRDLQDLRTFGVDIHSNKKSGIYLEGIPSKEKIIDIIVNYSRVINKDYALDKATSLIVEKQGIDAVRNFVLLQVNIEKCKKVKIDYNKIGSKIEREKIIAPLHLFQSEANWRLLAVSDGKIKQFLIDKITSVSQEEENFIKEDYNFSDLIKYSWRTWLSNDKIKVKLWFSCYWAERINPRMLVENQKVTKNSDGSMIFECIVNSLNEISAWIAARGEGVKVIEPQVLKEKVIKLAEGILKNYK